MKTYYDDDLVECVDCGNLIPPSSQRCVRCKAYKREQELLDKQEQFDREFEEIKDEGKGGKE